MVDDHPTGWESKTNARGVDGPRDPPAPPGDPPGSPGPDAGPDGSPPPKPPRNSPWTVWTRPRGSGRVRGPRPRAETGNGSVARGRFAVCRPRRRRRAPRARGGGEGTRRRREGAPVPLEYFCPIRRMSSAPGDRVGRTHVRTRVHREVARGTRHVEKMRIRARTSLRPNHSMRSQIIGYGGTPERGAVRPPRATRAVGREGKGREGRGGGRARAEAARGGRRDEERSGSRGRADATSTIERRADVRALALARAV